jgi:hypothetical protein
LGVYDSIYRDKKVVGVFVIFVRRFSRRIAEALHQERVEGVGDARDGVEQARRAALNTLTEEV